MTNGDNKNIWVRGDLHRRSSFFVLSKAAQEALMLHCRIIEFTSGETIFMQGEKHAFSYIVQSGLVKTYYVSESGREVTLGQWSEGDMIGGPLILGGGVHVWSSVAIKPSRLLAISGEELRELAGHYEEIYPWIIDVMSFKMLWMSILFQVQSTEQVQQRLIKLLLMLSDIYGEHTSDGTVIRHSITQSSLASLIGASRQWTNKTLNDLKDEQLIASREHHTVLLDKEKLRAMISSDQML